MGVETENMHGKYYILWSIVNCEDWLILDGGQILDTNKVMLLKMKEMERTELKCRVGK